MSEGGSVNEGVSIDEAVVVVYRLLGILEGRM